MRLVRDEVCPQKEVTVLPAPFNASPPTPSSLRMASPDSEEHRWKGKRDLRRFAIFWRQSLANGSTTLRLHEGLQPRLQISDDRISPAESTFGR